MLYSGFSYALFKNSLACIFYIKCIFLNRMEDKEFIVHSMLVHIVITGKYASNTNLLKEIVMFANVHWNCGLGKCQNLLVTDVYGKQTIALVWNQHLNHLPNCNFHLFV